MPVPSISANFPDVLDPRFWKLYDERYKQLKDMVGVLFDIVSGAEAPTKDTFRMSEMGTFGDIPEFTGTVTYDDITEQYDSTITPREYASGFQIERKLFDDALYGIMDGKPKALATAYQRTRQKHAAQLFNNAFSVDSTWLNNTENVSLCSNSHTTRTAGVSTANGFDNLMTGALNAVNLATARILMRGFRDDRANRIDIEPDELWIPPDLYQTAFEIDQSQGNPENANNAANVHRGRYTIHEWNYLNDVNNWFLSDSTYRKDMVKWVDRTPMEFAMVEEIDTIIGKWRLYARWGNGWGNWRWVCGSQVS